MLEAYMKSPYQKYCVNIVAEKLVKTVSPNAITLLAAVFGILVAVTLSLNYPKIAVIFLLISGYLDTLDGAIARLQNSSSEFGAVLDIVCDRVVEFSIIFGLYLVSPQSRSLVVILMLGSILLCITSFLVVGIFLENSSDKSFHYNSGLMERTEAFIFFIAMILFPQYFNLLGIIFTVLILYTVFRRILEFKNKN